MNKIIRLPSGRAVSVQRCITDIGNFSWGEATHNLKRIPPLIDIEENIIRTAYGLETIREFFDNKPIIISSWYRTPSANQKAGGSQKSRHLFGDAVDFNVAGHSPKHVFLKLDQFHNKGGLGLYSTHVHIDFRGNKARW